MKTRKIYYESAYLQEFEAEVIKDKQIDGRWCVALDGTGFYPGGGGQPPDIGLLGGMPVIDCFMKDGIIYHVMESMPFFKRNSTMRGKIDFNRRYAFMQNHSGEHVLSGLAKSRFGATNVGFHMSEKGFTIDFDLPLSAYELNELEKAANDIIWQGVDVQLSVVSGTEMAAIDARSKKDFAADEDVRLVDMPGYDLCACAGLHVANLHEVGIVKVAGHQRYKGGVRLYVYCGNDALWDYTRKNDIMRQVSVALSAETGSIIDAVGRQKNINIELKKEIDGLRSQIFMLKCAAIAENSTLEYYFEEGLDANDIRRFAKMAAEKTKIAIVFSGQDGAYKYAACTSDKTADFGGFVQDMLAALEGRGGVNGMVAQGAVKADLAAITAYLEGLR